MSMTVHNGIRYRAEDAERLGLTKKQPAKTATRKATARNKARTVEDEATGGAGDSA